MLKNKFFFFSLAMIFGFAAYITILERNLVFTTNADVGMIHENYLYQTEQLLQQAKGPNTSDLSGAYKLLPYWIFAGVHFILKGISPNIQFMLANLLIHFAGLLVFFLVAHFIYKDFYKSLFSLFFLALFLPVNIMPIFTFGQSLLIFSFFSICYAIFKKNNGMILFFSILGALVRPELVCCAILFKFLYDRFYLKKRGLKNLGMTALALSIPFAVFFGTVWYFGLWDHSDYTAILWERFLMNVISLRTMVLLFSPVLAFWMAEKFKWDPICRWMFIAIVPYFILVALIGNFTESRLLLPVVAVLILNVVSLLDLEIPSKLKGKTNT